MALAAFFSCCSVVFPVVFPLKDCFCFYLDVFVAFFTQSTSPPRAKLFHLLPTTLHNAEHNFLLVNINMPHMRCLTKVNATCQTIAAKTKGAFLLFASTFLPLPK